MLQCVQLSLTKFPTLPPSRHHLHFHLHSFFQSCYYAFAGRETLSLGSNITLHLCLNLLFLIYLYWFSRCCCRGRPRRIGGEKGPVMKPWLVGRTPSSWGLGSFGRPVPFPYCPYLLYYFVIVPALLRRLPRLAPRRSSLLSSSRLLLSLLPRLSSLLRIDDGFST